MDLVPPESPFDWDGSARCPDGSSGGAGGVCEVESIPEVTLTFRLSS